MSVHSSRTREFKANDRMFNCMKGQMWSRGNRGLTLVATSMVINE